MAKQPIYTDRMKAAKQQLMKAGVSKEEADAMMDRAGWDPKKLLKDPFFKPKLIPQDSGLYHTFVSAPPIVFKQADNEVIHPSKTAQAQIVFGTDRGDSTRSGWGAKGSQRCASIDLVVGRMSSVRNGKGPKLGADGNALVDNSFVSDAARIYISQLTDIDKNFGITEGAYGDQNQRSGIGIKADGVRIIGREGIKIVTGKANNFTGLGMAGERNSLGGKIKQPAPPIELIAGNNSETKEVFGGLFNTPEMYNNLQGVARGENTVECFRDLAEIIDEIWSAVFNFMIYQIIYNAAIGPALSPLPAAPIVASAASAAITAHINFSLNPLYHTRTNKTMWELNHLQRAGYRYVESRNVFST
jgi:hypothetical protein|tara:strand:+ start:1403 stop:2479 length:1077 start_codon:yes stop_codon:yes gene_type:complete